jgi:hypothetical protein
MPTKKVRLTKPKVTLKCVANTHTSPEERIIEFSHRRAGDGSEVAGGLINLMRFGDGSLRVCIYRCDEAQTIAQIGRDVQYHLPTDAHCVGVSGVLRKDDERNVRRIQSMLRHLAHAYDGDFRQLVDEALTASGTDGPS